MSWAEGSPNSRMGRLTLRLVQVLLPSFSGDFRKCLGGGCYRQGWPLGGVQQVPHGQLVSWLGISLCALFAKLETLVHSGEKTAKDLNITREEQDTYAIASYKKAAAAWAAKAFDAEIAPVTIADKRKGDVVIVEDEEFKKVKLDKIPSLRPVFQKDGTITAANASTLNDGASALVLASQEKVNELSLKPLARIVCKLRSSRAFKSFAFPTDVSSFRSLCRCRLCSHRLSHRSRTCRPSRAQKGWTHH